MNWITSCCIIARVTDFLLKQDSFFNVYFAETLWRRRNPRPKPSPFWSPTPRREAPLPWLLLSPTNKPSQEGVILVWGKTKFIYFKGLCLRKFICPSPITIIFVYSRSNKSTGTEEEQNADDSAEERNDQVSPEEDAVLPVDEDAMESPQEDARDEAVEPVEKTAGETAEEDSEEDAGGQQQSQSQKVRGEVTNTRQSGQRHVGSRSNAMGSVCAAQPRAFGLSLKRPYEPDEEQEMSAEQEQRIDKAAGKRRRRRDDESEQRGVIGDLTQLRMTGQDLRRPK